jgi:hypothetical protein
MRTRITPMSQWSDPERWARLQNGEACPICLQGAPNDILVELESSWVTVNEDALMRGYVTPISRLGARAVMTRRSY